MSYCELGGWMGGWVVDIGVVADVGVDSSPGRVAG